jgi:hypothetical protein
MELIIIAVPNRISEDQVTELGARLAEMLNVDTIGINVLSGEDLLPECECIKVCTDIEDSEFVKALIAVNELIDFNSADITNRFLECVTSNLIEMPILQALAAGPMSKRDHVIGMDLHGAYYSKLAKGLLTILTTDKNGKNL